MILEQQKQALMGAGKRKRQDKKISNHSKKNKGRNKKGEQIEGQNKHENIKVSDIAKEIRDEDEREIQNKLDQDDSESSSDILKPQAVKPPVPPNTDRNDNEANQSLQNIQSQIS